jgi:hypothetical protein
MATITVTVLVLNSGSIDIDGTCEALRLSLEEREAKFAGLNERISNEVRILFDSRIGKPDPLHVPQVIACVMPKLCEATDPSFQEISARVGAWLSSSPDFYVAKGRGGGVRRFSDMSQEDATKARESQFAKAAAKAAK